jgi:hypothetical protein
MVLMAQAFDLQDTLVHINYASTLRETLAGIATAKKLMNPSGDFTVISAQPDIRAIHREIRIMVTDLFPNVQGIHFVSGNNIAAKKAELIKRLAITEYTDNDEGILRAINIALEGSVKLYLARNGVRVPVKPYKSL